MTAPVVVRQTFEQKQYQTCRRGFQLETSRVRTGSVEVPLALTVAAEEPSGS